MTRENLKKAVLNINSQNFDATALAIFQYQYQYNVIYKQFVDLLKINPQSINVVEKIPFLPISFFKNFEIKTGDWQPEIVFSSSGTTGQITSQHFVRDLDLYQKITEQGFEYF
jgi:phenylacetate-coenzyme A ligase PaaK-like adenylate-forming protein